MYAHLSGRRMARLAQTQSLAPRSRLTVHSRSPQRQALGARARGLAYSTRLRAAQQGRRSSDSGSQVAFALQVLTQGTSEAQHLDMNAGTVDSPFESSNFAPRASGSQPW